MKMNIIFPFQICIVPKAPIAFWHICLLKLTFNEVLFQDNILDEIKAIHANRSFTWL
jgi:hypothetical protein